MNYNLLDEEWIPVLYHDGRFACVGIKGALIKAHRIRQIAASNPMDRVAILRFFLALLYWCKGNPPDGGFPDTSFPPEWFTILDENEDCFNLLGKGRRFYQYEADKKCLAATSLVHEVPTGTNFHHFRHSTDNTNGLCLVCSAMGLLRLPAFATSGGSGKSPGINAKPPIYVIPFGSSLAETLRLSWRKVSESDLGTPAWEKPDVALPKSGVIPVLTGLTWLPRRVWLADPGGDQSSCISCGRKGHLITKCVFAGIGSTRTDEGGQARDWRDPHVINDSNGVIRPSDAIGASGAAAGHWTKILAGVLGIQKQRKRLWIVGFATVQNDKYLEATEYEIPLHNVPDEQKIQESIEIIKKWQEAGKSLAKDVAKQIKRIEKASSRKHVDIRPIVDAIRHSVEDTVAAKQGDLVAGSDDVWEQAASEYSPMMDAVAQSLAPGCATAALERRKLIASLKPNMRSKKRGGKAK